MRIKRNSTPIWSILQRAASLDRSRPNTPVRSKRPRSAPVILLSTTDAGGLDVDEIENSANETNSNGSLSRSNSNNRSESPFLEKSNGFGRIRKRGFSTQWDSSLKTNLTVTLYTYGSKTCHLSLPPSLIQINLTSSNQTQDFSGALFQYPISPVRVPSFAKSFIFPASPWPLSYQTEFINNWQTNNQKLDALFNTKWSSCWEQFFFGFQHLWASKRHFSMIGPSKTFTLQYSQASTGAFITLRFSSASTHWISKWQSQFFLISDNFLNMTPSEKEEYSQSKSELNQNENQNRQIPIYLKILTISTKELQSAWKLLVAFCLDFKSRIVSFLPKTLNNISDSFTSEKLGELNVPISHDSKSLKDGKKPIIPSNLVLLVPPTLYSTIIFPFSTQSPNFFRESNPENSENFPIVVGVTSPTNIKTPTEPTGKLQGSKSVCFHSNSIWHTSQIDGLLAFLKTKFKNFHIQFETFSDCGNLSKQEVYRIEFSNSTVQTSLKIH